jgi:hypothetical protein
MKKTLLFAVALAGSFSFVTPAQAHQEIQSPKGKELTKSVRTVPGTTTADILKNPTQGSPKSRELQNSTRTADVKAPEYDLANAPRPGYAPKDPRYQDALVENAIREVQVAPLK